MIPCLNEEEAIAGVVEEAFAGLEEAGVTGEVIVVDNASEDRSAELAREAGATVVYEPRRGYGSAYLAGLAAARGTYVVMADADGTYPLDLIGAFVEKLRGGADMVIGSRFKGTIHPGAMPWPNRYIGNPILTGMLNTLFRTGVSDAHCGLRAVRRDALPTLQALGDGHGVRLGDGDQGREAPAAGRGDPDRLPPADRRLEALARQRRLAPRALHARLQPDVPVHAAGRARHADRARRGDRARRRPGPRATRGRASRSRSRCSRSSGSA